MYSRIKAIVQDFISKLHADSLNNQGHTPYFLVTVVTENRGVVTEESYGGFVIKLTTSENIDFIAAKAHELTAKALDLFARQRTVIVDDDRLGQSRVIYLSSEHVIVITVIGNNYNSKNLSANISNTISTALQQTK